jgi:hypothetical protein
MKRTVLLGMKKKILFLLLSISIPFLAEAQHRCGSDKVFAQVCRRDSTAISRKNVFDALVHQYETTSPLNPKLNDVSNASKANAIIVIPIVVHLVYNTTAQNISDAQIRSQISVLNADYRMKNTDTLPLSHPFWSATADAGIEFCLATTDPNGDPTTGIIRTFTSTTRFDYDTINNWSDVKFTATGGADRWDPHRYLNVWVCNLTGSILAISTFPSELAATPDEDGIVVNYRFMGAGGTALSPYNQGRTLTHEIGHWLGLAHIWGDAFCGNDVVSDTRPAESENYGCPTFPHRPNNLCGGDANGEMYMNYMDYVDDRCMNMFTFGQVTRMQATLSTLRSSIVSSHTCTSTAGIEEPNALRFSVFPNPAKEMIEVYLGNQMMPHGATITLRNEWGEIVLTHALLAFEESVQLDISSLSNGFYTVQISDGITTGVKRLIVLK